jgi:hypothetical protein
MKRTIAGIASGVLLFMVSVSVWAAPGDIISVDNWTEYPVGALLLSVPGTWTVYSSMKVFKYPPTVVLDEFRFAAHGVDHRDRLRDPGPLDSRLARDSARPDGRARRADSTVEAASASWEIVAAG